MTRLEVCLQIVRVSTMWRSKHSSWRSISCSMRTAECQSSCQSCKCLNCSQLRRLYLLDTDGFSAVRTATAAPQSTHHACAMHAPCMRHACAMRAPCMHTMHAPCRCYACTLHAHACVLLPHAACQAYKLQQLLAVGSVVLHPASTWRTYFYGAMLPYVHYVPLWRAAEDDVLPTLRWLKRHDRVARRIGATGRRLACEHLTQSGRLCYWRRLLRAYAELTDSVATLAERPRAFPLARLNIMCRERDAPNVCYYNVQAGPLPKGYACHKPVPGREGMFEECWYEGDN